MLRIGLEANLLYTLSFNNSVYIDFIINCANTKIKFKINHLFNWILQIFKKNAFLCRMTIGTFRQVHAFFFSHYLNMMENCFSRRSVLGWARLRISMRLL